MFSHQVCLTSDEVASVIDGALTEGACGRSDYERCVHLEERFRKVKYIASCFSCSSILVFCLINYLTSMGVGDVTRV